MRNMLIFLVSSQLFFGCAHVSDGPTGFLVQNTMIGESGARLGGKKAGEACAHSLFGLIAFGDASVETAAKRGGVTEIGTVTHENLSALGLYASQCTIVRGN